jgi:hypothetical protein
MGRQPCAKISQSLLQVDLKKGPGQVLSIPACSIIVTGSVKRMVALALNGIQPMRQEKPYAKKLSSPLGVGMAIGRALLPIGAFPLGGILIGALFATSAYKASGKLFPSLAKPGPSKS